VKILTWVGDALDVIRAFDEDAQDEIGYQLHRVQCGENPYDWKPMSDIGSGVREIRIRVSKSAYRVIYIASFEESVYVLHAFQKKTQKTLIREVRLAKRRLTAVLNERGET